MCRSYGLRCTIPYFIAALEYGHCSGRSAKPSTTGIRSISLASSAQAREPAIQRLESI